MRRELSTFLSFSFMLLWQVVNVDSWRTVLARDVCRASDHFYAEYKPDIPLFVSIFSYQ